MENVLSFTDARAMVEKHAAQLKSPATERAPLLNAPGRVLAEPIICDRDLPPFNRSTRDGFAVRSGDVTGTPTELRVVGELRAGQDWPQPLLQGEALEIMTGAGLPPG